MDRGGGQKEEAGSGGGLKSVHQVSTGPALCPTPSRGQLCAPRLQGASFVPRACKGPSFVPRVRPAVRNQTRLITHTPTGASQHVSWPTAMCLAPPTSPHVPGPPHLPTCAWPPPPAGDTHAIQVCIKGLHSLRAHRTNIISCPWAENHNEAESAHITTRRRFSKTKW